MLPAVARFDRADRRRAPIDGSRRGTRERAWRTTIVRSHGPKPFIVNPFSKMEPGFSPDGKWLAYTSNETGRREVYVAALPSGGKLQISNMGGVNPVWRRNGRELYYRDRNHIMSVTIQAGAELKAGGPKPMFDAPDYVSFAAMANGRVCRSTCREGQEPGESQSDPQLAGRA